MNLLPIIKTYFMPLASKFKITPNISFDRHYYSKAKSQDKDFHVGRKVNSKYTGVWFNKIDSDIPSSSTKAYHFRDCACEIFLEYNNKIKQVLGRFFCFSFRTKP